MSLDKILAVAGTEFRAMVRSKAFLISISILPIVILGMSFAQRQLAARVDTEPRRFAVVDQSGQVGKLYPVVEAAARAREQQLAADLAEGRAPKPSFQPERVEVGDRPLDQLRLQLSERVRKEELFAFVEIPANPAVDKLRYYSDHPAYDDLRDWLARTVDEALKDESYRQAHLDPALIESLKHKVSTETLGLWTRDADGRVHPAEKQDVIRTVVLPIVPVFLLFFFIVTSVPQLMNSVMTEKTSRISEVLLGSLSPTELMAGKLLGSVGVSLLLGVAYLACGVAVASKMGYSAAITPSLVAWFLAFLVLAMLLYGSASMAIGAACNDLKDAQNLMLPVMLPLMIPMMMLMTVVEAPSSRLAVALSLFPPATPLVMLLRVGVHPAAPLWQVALGAAGALLNSALCVWAAGRIFRVGLLAQGKSPSLAQMIRWVFER